MAPFKKMSKMDYKNIVKPILIWKTPLSVKSSFKL